MNMKLKFFIAGVAIVAGLASAVSCQDLSKDLTALQNKVNSLESTVQNLQAKIDAGAVITSVTPTNSGIVITLSNGNKYEITNGVNGKDGTNGKDGKDGSVVTIGANGNWFIDGEDTGLAAAGQDGTPGEYYVPNPETGCFDKYVWVEENGAGAYVKEATTISFLAPGTITAVYDPENNCVVLYGVEGWIGGYVIGGGGSASTLESISLYNYAAGAGAAEIFTTITEQENEFHGLVFGDGTQVQRNAEIVVKVVPANYQLKAEDIAIVNSKGEELDQVVITEVAKHTGLVVKSGETGLWDVKMEISEFDEAAFKKAVLRNPSGGYVAGNFVAFGVKVGECVTDYDLAFEQHDYAAAPAAGGTRPSLLDFVLVDNPDFPTSLVWVDNTINRYAAGKELRWKTTTVKYPTPATSIVKESGVAMNAENDAATATFTGDDRNPATATWAVSYYNAILNQPIYIVPTGDVRALYVTLDESNAASVDELNTWKTYDIAGLNQLFDDEYPVITIKSASAKGDIIGFRVYSVNWDGTLTDPDGKAFYVKAGDPATDWDTVAMTMTTADNFIGNVSGKSSITTKKVATAASIQFTVLTKAGYGVNPNNEKFSITLKNANNGNIGTLNDGVPQALTAANSYWGLHNADNAQTIKGIVANPIIPAGKDLYVFKDDAPYYGLVEILDADDFVLAQFYVSFTKSMPEGAPSGFSAKTAQIVDGVYNCYLEPNTWVAPTAANGTMGMTTVFNFPTNATVAGKINIAFKKSDKNASGSWIDVNANNTTPLSIKKDYIDSKTAHETSVTYNYGPISSEDMSDSDNDGVLDTYNDVKREIMAFNTVYHNLYDTYTWAWHWGATGAAARAAYKAVPGMVDPGTFTPSTAVPSDPFALDTKPVITYGVAATFNTAQIAGTSSWSTTYNAPLITPYKGTSLIITPDTATASGHKEPNVISNGSSVKDEYFTAVWNAATGDVVLTPVATASEPAANVESKLVLYVTDMYGKNREVKLDLTIKKP